MILFLFLFSADNLRGQGFRSFGAKLTKECPQIEQLIIKKVFIESNTFQGDDLCQRPFSKNLIERCSNITCLKLRDVLATYQSERPGSIIGK